MFCLRSWLPLLFIPTNASPVFILLFFVCTYFLNRPCIYCSLLLVILFASSCHWSEHCFFDLSRDWFAPRAGIVGDGVVSGSSASNGTCAALPFPSAAASSLFDDMLCATSAAMASVAGGASSTRHAKDAALLAARRQWTGIGLEWLRSLLGRREWRLPCVDVVIRL